MQSLVLPVLVLVSAVAVHSAGMLKPLERELTEARFALDTRAPTGRLLLVDIDARSLAEIGTWPWPRTIHAGIVDGLAEAGAAEIAFDIDFSANSTEADDLALEQALERFGGVVLAAFNQAAETGSTDVHANIPLDRFARSSWLASVNVEAGADGTVRRMPVGGDVGGVTMPSMAALLGGYSGPVEGEFLVDFGIDAGGFDRVSAIEIIDGTVDPRRIAGKSVIVGAAAVELRDLFDVPVWGIVSGPTLQALAAESILQGRMIAPAGAAVRLTGTVLILALFLVFRRYHWRRMMLILAGSGLAIEAGAFLLLDSRPILLDTSLWQASLVGLGLSRMVGEIALRRIMIARSRTETANTRTILSQVVTDSFAGIVVVDEDGTIRTASRKAEEMLGSRSTPLHEGNCDDLLPAPMAAGLRGAITACRDRGECDGGPVEFVTTTNSNGQRIIDCVIRPSRLEGGIDGRGRRRGDEYIATATFIDVTERRRAEEQLTYLARFDTLTGLPNRNNFFERLSAAIADPTARPGGVFLVGLDRFKAINDVLGHGRGDLLLGAVGARLATLLGPNDVAARFGGDEFAVLRIGTAERDFADELIEAIGEIYEVEGHRLVVGVSVGVSEIDGSDAETMLKRADTALWRAKSAGGNTHRTYRPGMDAGLRERQELELDLWEAYEKQQFEVYYQPQVRLDTREIVGAEALLRWKHPERGFVSPAEFIPIAETIGLIEPLGAWVLRRACEDAAQWPRPLKLGVNVSPVQFARGDLLAEVRHALATTAISPDRLDLEITESLFVQEAPTIRRTMDRLRQLGITFSIDDFGTGYSALSYIRRFPVQKIKIDQSFVRGLPQDEEAAGLVRAIAAMAQSLGLGLIAEGVETEEQATLLRLVGSAEGQGWLFGKPMPAAAFLELLDRDSADGSVAAAGAA